MTMIELIKEVTTLSIYLKNNGGLDFAVNNEASFEFEQYELIVNLIDDTFYKICDKNNLVVNDFYCVVESAIKKHLPDFIY